jgi:hypothetical protein
MFDRAPFLAVVTVGGRRHAAIVDDGVQLAHGAIADKAVGRALGVTVGDVGGTGAVIGDQDQLAGTDLGPEIAEEIVGLGAWCRSVVAVVAVEDILVS